jgi:hypothetical protein
MVGSVEPVRLRRTPCRHREVGQCDVISSKEFASSEAVARGVKPTVSEILVVGY